MDNNATMSQRKYADYIGVSEGAVRKAIERGDISFGYNTVLKSIDPVLAEKNDWVQKQKVIKAKPGVSRAKTIEKLDKHLSDGLQKLPDTSDINPEDTEDVIIDLTTEELLNKLKLHPTMSAQQASRVNEIIDAALNKKKLEEAAGVLVRKDAVEKALFVMGNELKKALFNIPQRVVRDIMTANSEVEAINLLTSQLTEVLETYGNLKTDSFNQN